MADNEMTKKDNFPIIQSFEDEIDFNAIGNFFKRNSRILAGFAGLGLILGAFYSLSKPRVYQGQFQIIYSNNNDRQKTLSTSSFLNGMLPNSSNSLKTDMIVLRSEYLLEPVFNFVNEEKSKKNRGFSNLQFDDWVQSIKIDRAKGSNSLSILYRDSNKDLIIPVLKRTLKIYQDYSNESIIQEINSGLEYLDSQIKLYTRISSESYKKAKTFAFENDLYSPINQISNEAYSNKSFSSIEDLRVKSLNKIRKLENQFNQINLLGIEQPGFLELANEYTSNIYKKNVEIITKLQNQILQKENIFKEDDPELLKLIKQKNQFLQIFKNTTLNSINANLLSEKAFLKSIERPKNVMNQYADYMLTANADQATLNQLKSQYRKLSLDLARKRKPWSLIKRPKLDINPVSQSRKQLASFGLLFGSFFGILISYISEKKKDVIYNISFVRNLFYGIPSLHLHINSDKSWQTIMNIFINDNATKHNNNSLALICFEEPLPDSILLIKKSLESSFKGIKILITNELQNNSQYPHQLLVTFVGITRKKDLEKFRTTIDFNSNLIQAIMVIED